MAVLTLAEWETLKNEWHTQDSTEYLRGLWHSKEYQDRLKQAFLDDPAFDNDSFIQLHRDYEIGDCSGLFINNNRTITQSQCNANAKPNFTQSRFQFDSKPKPNFSSSCVCSKCAKFAVMHKIEKFYIGLPCNKWTCAICGKKNAENLAKRMEQSEANRWPLKTHIILTVSGEHESKIIDEAYNDLLTFLRRGGRFDFIDHKGHSRSVVLPARPNLKYIKVKEIQVERMQKFGEVVLHIHVVFNQFLTKYDLIPIWNHALKLHGSKSVFNYVEDTHPHNFNAGKYLFKYFTKEEYQDLFEKGERRYGCSRGVIPPEPVRTPSGLWEFMSLTDARLVREYFDKSTSNARRSDISRSVCYDSRRSGDIIRSVVNGVAV